ncbi:hypothetical protein [Peribacillus acanthi]|uniref:hypothetical protein n=1 Tax=Peribacillus acanthi TaxID=2171554 RepID=UPI000D3E060A|nr:hypothetical protein [Peribacillus acanthi]
MKKIMLPLIYVVELVLFFYVLIFVFLFNMVYFANIVLIDMPWEEPITFASPLIKSLMIICGAGILGFLYIKYLTGNRVYRKIKEVIWGILLGSNALSCMLWLIVGYPFDFSNDQRIELLFATLISLLLTIQIFMKFRNENK